MKSEICWQGAAHHKEMDCTSQSAVSKRGFPSSRWDCPCATENIDTVKGKKWICAPCDLEEELLNPSEEGGPNFLDERR